MKIFLIAIAALVALTFVIQLYITISTNETKEQPYKVIQADKNFEVRYYPAAIMATVNSNVKSYKALGSSGFRTLAGYIFGGNDANKQIAMTAPVHMAIDDSISSMSFVMPANYDMNNLPKPNNASVEINSSKAEYVVAISFGGFASDEKIQDYTNQLKALLALNHINPLGNYRYLGYNPPYQLFGRRNEIIVAVDWEHR
jgi:hypothetical protein